MRVPTDMRRFNRSGRAWPVLACLLGCSEASTGSEAAPAAATPEPVASGPAVAEGCVATVAELPPSPGLELADPRLREPAVIVAHKSSRRLMLFGDGRLHACLPMGLGFGPQGHKHVEGDGRTPEGWYRTSDKPWSDFPGAIAVHYPNERDARAAFADGRLSAPQLDGVLTALASGQVPPQQTSMGGEILIHGGGNQRDWTLGCMALADDDLERLRAMLPEAQRAWLLVLP